MYYTIYISIQSERTCRALLVVSIAQQRLCHSTVAQWHQSMQTDKFLLVCSIPSFFFGSISTLDLAQIDGHSIVFPSLMSSTSVSRERSVDPNVSSMRIVLVIGLFMHIQCQLGIELHFVPKFFLSFFSPSIYLFINLTLQKLPSPWTLAFYYIYEK